MKEGKFVARGCALRPGRGGGVGKVYPVMACLLIVDAVLALAPSQNRSMMASYTANSSANPLHGIACRHRGGLPQRVGAPSTAWRP
jgi:hypothetical protein